jgi:hypothetical protein
MSFRKVDLLLADYACVTPDGKLTVVGAGWTVTGPGPAPSAVAVIIEVDWTATNTRHHAVLSLSDQDGRPVFQQGGEPIQVTADFETGRPAGLPEGTGMNFPFAVNLGLLPLVPGNRYVWELTIDGEHREDWSLPFLVRQAPPEVPGGLPGAPA